MKWTLMDKCTSFLSKNRLKKTESVFSFSPSTSDPRISNKHIRWLDDVNESELNVPVYCKYPMRHEQYRTRLGQCRMCQPGCESNVKSIGESNFAQIDGHFDHVRSHSQYAMYFAKNPEAKRQDSSIWAPILGQHSFGYDSSSNCESCLELIEEIQMHRQFQIGRHSRRMPPIDPKRSIEA